MSKDAYYIKHDCNSRRDIKIMAMLSEYGMAGYGMYWTLIEIMREQSNYMLEKNKFLYAVLSKDMMCSAVDSERFIKSCINDFELFEEDETHIFSSSLIRRMQKLDELRAIRSAAGKKGSRKKEKQEEDPFPIKKEMKVNEPVKKEDYVIKFLNLFNELKKKHKPNNYKHTESLTASAKKNLKIIIKKYSEHDILCATDEMFKNKWASDTGNQTPTHLLVEKNFERYLELSQYQQGKVINQSKKPIAYG